jgi:hypothetical protein
MTARDVFTIDNLLHILGGAALAALLLPAYWSPWSLPICCWVAWSIWGLLREQAQSMDANDFWIPFRSWHKTAEGLSWGVGALLGAGIPILILEVVSRRAD